MSADRRHEILADLMVRAVAHIVDDRVPIEVAIERAYREMREDILRYWAENDAELPRDPGMKCH
jgi:hypothetical protein